MRIAICAAMLGLSLATAASAASITADQAMTAYEAGKAKPLPQNGYAYASCAGYWSAWTKHALENYKDSFVAALPEDVTSSSALKNQLYWQEKAVGEVKAGKVQGPQAQSMLVTSRAMVDTSLAEDTETAMKRLFGELGRCHVQR